MNSALPAAWYWLASAGRGISSLYLFIETIRHRSVVGCPVAVVVWLRCCCCCCCFGRLLLLWRGVYICRSSCCYCCIGWFVITVFWLCQVVVSVVVVVSVGAGWPVRAVELVRFIYSSRQFVTVVLSVAQWQ